MHLLQYAIDVYTVSLLIFSCCQSSLDLSDYCGVLGGLLRSCCSPCFADSLDWCASLYSFLPSHYKFVLILFYVDELVSRDVLLKQCLGRLNIQSFLINFLFTRHYELDFLKYYSLFELLLSPNLTAYATYSLALPIWVSLFQRLNFYTNI